MSTDRPYGSPQWQLLTNGFEGGGTGGGIAEAPTDGQLYSRQGSTASWIVSPTGGGGSVAWDSITGKPSTFPPAAHVHVIADVTGLQTALNGKEPTIAIGLATQYWRGDKSWQLLDWAAIASKPTTFTPSAHVHVIADTTGLQTALNAKEPTIAAGTTAQYWRGDKSWQAHDKASVGLGNVDNTSDLAKPISTATATALAGKEPTIAGGTTAQFWRGDKSWQAIAVDWTNITGKPATFPPSTHSHAIADVTGLQAALDGKLNLSGGTMTGFIALHADPASPMNPATKQYVDAKSSGIYIGDTAPTTPVAGMQWWRSSTGATYLYYADANTSQWVQTNSAGLGEAPNDGVLYGRISGTWGATHTKAAIDAGLNLKLNLSGGAMTGLLVPSASAGGMASSVVSRAGLEIKSDGVAGSAAFIAFHRPGQFAGYFGLDGDNVWKVGGWSHGDAAYTIYHTGNLNPGAYLPLTGGTVTGYMQTNAALRAYGELWVNSQIQCDAATLLIGANGGTIYFRPHGTGNDTSSARLQADGQLVAKSFYIEGGGMDSNHAVLLGCNNNHVYMRPYGKNNATNEYRAQNDGWFYNSTAGGGFNGSYYDSTSGVYGGFRCKNGGNGGNYANVFNMGWAGIMQLFVDNTWLGNIAFQSDYRIKKDVADLGSMWETIRKLRPIKYTHQEFWPTTPAPPDSRMQAEGKPALEPEPLIKDDDIERWGFIAHELQEAMIMDAATGVKDEPNILQSPNPWTVLSAAVRALQEAMERIEALEARA